MNQDTTNLNVLGLEIAFRSGADMERVRRAARLVEEKFEVQQSRSRGQSKDVLLTFLALGLADDVLQSKKELGDVRERIHFLLSKIEESE